ncbi:hypothetical protein E2C01_057082 [Portunus trituberculatus]|uniref:Uncharacterized protein n=1 Tax=Portunus trituberculatus TaxID=210409 RepID=A0A5B7H1D1_PORTR|nr:hypothetical protein [Portunus trituberculatus]
MWVHKAVEEEDEEPCWAGRRRPSDVCVGCGAAATFTSVPCGAAGRQQVGGTDELGESARVVNGAAPSKRNLVEWLRPETPPTLRSPPPSAGPPHTAAAETRSAAGRSGSARRTQTFCNISDEAATRCLDVPRPRYTLRGEGPSPIRGTDNRNSSPSASRLIAGPRCHNSG